jgi:hypothetical protein
MASAVYKNAGSADCGSCADDAADHRRGNSKPELQRVTGSGVCSVVTNAGRDRSLWRFVLSGDAANCRDRNPYGAGRATQRNIATGVAGWDAPSVDWPDFRIDGWRGCRNADQINSLRHTTARPDCVRGNDRAAFWLLPGWRAQCRLCAPAGLNPRKH